MTKIALIGTGFVADYYMTTLANYPELELAGAWDHDFRAAGRILPVSRRARFYGSLAECLGDPDVAIIVNLTSPESHYGAQIPQP